MRIMSKLFRHLPWLTPLVSLSACGEQVSSSDALNAAQKQSTTGEAASVATKPTTPTDHANTPPPTAGGPSNAQALPEQWEQLTHAQWRQALGISKCDLDAQEQESRFRFVVDLNPPVKLLLIACDMGAYQDAYRLFLINPSEKTVRPQHPWTPDSESPKTLIQPEMVWGNVYYEPGGQVELTYLSAGSGACGYRALYTVEAFSREATPKPIQVFADADCYNGVLVEQWPEITLEK